jgi:hypothetical protein
MPTSMVEATPALGNAQPPIEGLLSIMSKTNDASKLANQDSELRDD